MIQEKELARPLMQPNEIMALDDNKMIVFTPSTSPMIVNRLA